MQVGLVHLQWEITSGKCCCAFCKNIPLHTDNYGSQDHNIPTKIKKPGIYKNRINRYCLLSQVTTASALAWFSLNLNYCTWTVLLCAFIVLMVKQKYFQTEFYYWGERSESLPSLQPYLCFNVAILSVCLSVLTVTIIMLLGLMTLYQFLRALLRMGTTIAI